MQQAGPAAIVAEGDLADNARSFACRLTGRLGQATIATYSDACRQLVEFLRLLNIGRPELTTLVGSPTPSASLFESSSSTSPQPLGYSQTAARAPVGRVDYVSAQRVKVVPEQIGSVASSSEDFGTGVVSEPATAAS